MSFVKWLVSHKILIAVLYSVINIILHILLITIFDGLALATFINLCELPSSLLYSPLIGLLLDTMWSLLEGIPNIFYIVIQGILAITTNAFILIGLITLLGKIFKVKRNLSNKGRLPILD